LATERSIGCLPARCLRGVTTDLGGVLPCLLSLAGGLALAAAAWLAGWRLLAGDTTDIGNAVRRKSIGVTTNLLQSMAPDCTAALTCIPLCPQSLKNLHTLDTAAIWYGAGHMARCMQQSRVCAGKDRDCGQNSIPVRSQSAAQSGAFYICALRLLASSLRHEEHSARSAC